MRRPSPPVKQMVRQSFYKKCCFDFCEQETRNVSVGVYLLFWLNVAIFFIFPEKFSTILQTLLDTKKYAHGVTV
jgi:hypothetical protein